MSGLEPTESDLTSTARVRRLVSFDLASLTDLAPGIERPVRLVGFDEAGRGALAGPVTVGCVSFDLPKSVSLPSGPLDPLLVQFVDLDDSKRVTPRRRERLCRRVAAEARHGVGFASAIEIDRHGIVEACRRAALRAYRNLGRGPEGCCDLGLFDRGLSLGHGPSLGRNAMTACSQITHGDAMSFHIAAASILAKVSRDALMCRLADRVPEYAFPSHKGYGTPAHIDAIRRHGPSAFHRKTFLSLLH
jgi:ribonuclease HII